MNYPPSIESSDKSHDGNFWNDYWHNVIANIALLPDAIIGRGWQQSRAAMPLLNRFGLQRGIWIGSGITVQPKMLAYIGCKSTAIDISSVACDFARKRAPTDMDIEQFFAQTTMERELDSGAMVPRIHPKLTAEFIERERRPSGYAEFVVADVMEYELGVAQFDFAVLHYVIEYLSDSDALALASRIFRALVPGGILLVETPCLRLINYPSEGISGVESVFEGAGFVHHLKAAYESLSRHRQRGWWNKLLNEDRRLDETDARFENLVSAGFDADMRRVEGGAKLAILGLPPYSRDTWQVAHLA